MTCRVGFRPCCPDFLPLRELLPGVAGAPAERLLKSVLGFLPPGQDTGTVTPGVPYAFIYDRIYASTLACTSLALPPGEAPPVAVIGSVGMSSPVWHRGARPARSGRLTRLVSGVWSRTDGRLLVGVIRPGPPISRVRALPRCSFTRSPWSRRLKTGSRSPRAAWCAVGLGEFVPSGVFLV